MEKEYDYIIAGAGCAGLSLGFRISKDPFFNDKKVLILDKEVKDKNDRTWCHWSAEKGLFDKIVHKSWSHMTLHDQKRKLKYDMSPYEYKMIRGIDFYNFVFPELKQNPNINFLPLEISNIEELEDVALVNTPAGQFTTKQVFKSYYTLPDKLDDHMVLQHFKGYFIRSKDDFFKESSIRFMDFRTEQYQQTRFFYVLPTSKTEALVELAIFSNQVLKQEEYDNLLKNYINRYLRKMDFEIIEEEFGIIPMTTYDFKNEDTPRICHIGTAAGCVKPSSGFAFRRIQDHCEAIIEALKKNQNPITAQEVFKNKYKRYDKIFMNVLLSDKAKGSKVFMDLFEKLDPQLVFKFLDEETSFGQELRLFTAPPTLPFLKAFFEEL